MKISFVGGGVMAETILNGILDNKIAAPRDVAVGEVIPNRREYLAHRYGVRAEESNVSAIEGSGLVILSVKPQNLAEVFSQVNGKLNEGQTAISIVAGARMKGIVRGLGHPNVIRVMPNTPGQIGFGMTVWMASDTVGQGEVDVTRRVLATLGEEVYVHDEKYIDMATALSASGPAYVFLFIESLIEAGVYLGMPRDMARQLVLQTVLGSAQLVKQTEKHPAELRDMVTSPGGTTAEALLELEDSGVRAALINAVVAAYEKSQALGGLDEG